MTRFSFGLLVALLGVAHGCASSPRATTAEPPSAEPSSGDEPRRPPFTVVDAMPAFWEFWERAEGLDADEAFALFEQTVVAAHPTLYAPEVLGLDPEDSGALRARFGPWFEALPSRVDQMRAIHADFPSTLDQQTRRFMEALPAFDWDGKVHLFASVDSFNGAGRSVAGEGSLLFGLDVMAQPTLSMPPPVLFAHELFHFHQRLPEEWNVAAALWAEGLAVHASEVLNPSATLEEVLPPSHLHDPEDPRLIHPERGISWASDMPRYERELAGEILVALESEDPNVYGTFFLGRASPALGERPVRSGYYLGLRVARELAGDRSLHELSQLPMSEVLPSIRRVLRSIAEGGGHSSGQ